VFEPAGDDVAGQALLFEIVENKILLLVGQPGACF
jgi:hypothetical protein